MYERMWGGPDDGGIKRGDRANTGDEVALPFSGDADEIDDQFDTLENYPMAGGDLAELTILEADDPALGLTNIGGKPGQDWAANTGPTHSNEEFDETGSL